MGQHFQSRVELSFEKKLLFQYSIRWNNDISCLTSMHSLYNLRIYVSLCEVYENVGSQLHGTENIIQKFVRLYQIKARLLDAASEDGGKARCVIGTNAVFDNSVGTHLDHAPIELGFECSLNAWGMLETWP